MTVYLLWLSGCAAQESVVYKRRVVQKSLGEGSGTAERSAKRARLGTNATTQVAPLRTSAIAVAQTEHRVRPSTDNQAPVQVRGCISVVDCQGDKLLWRQSEVADGAVCFFGNGGAQEGARVRPKADSGTAQSGGVEALRALRALGDSSTSLNMVVVETKPQKELKPPKSLDEIRKVHPC